MHQDKGGGAASDGEGDNLESGSCHRNHHQRFSGVSLRITLVLAVVVLSYLLLFQSSHPFDFFRKSFSLSDSTISSSSSPSCDDQNQQYHQYTSRILSPPAEEENNELEKALKKAVMKDNKTVIITTLNAAWTEPNSIFDLFLESFRIGNGTQHLLKHVVVGAFDRTAYNRCLAAGMYCVAVATDGIDFSGEASFMSKDYLKMVWRKIDFQRSVLELGFDFVFTDGDVMWLRNPFERFYPVGDFQVSCDRYQFNNTNLRNWPNSGFIYAKSNNRTIQFYNYWYTGQDYFPGKHDQDVLNYIKMNPLVGKMGLEIRFLETDYFGGFCEPSKDLDMVITMHANCCVGMGRKIHGIKMVIQDWKRYVSLPAHQRNSSVRSWTAPRLCG